MHGRSFDRTFDKMIRGSSRRTVKAALRRVLFYVIVSSMITLLLRAISHVTSHTLAVDRDVELLDISEANNDLSSSLLDEREKLSTRNISRDSASQVSKSTGVNVRNLPVDLYKLAAEPFDTIPKNFLHNYKNPCFLEEEDVPTTLRCLPYFYLIGFQKCATTDVWEKVESHPDITETLKEPHWWARYRVIKTPTWKKILPLDWYLRLSLKHIKRLISENGSHRHLVMGDGSTSMISDNRWQRSVLDRFQGPNYVMADVIHEIQPDAKFIIMLRNPTTRTYSDYLMFGSDPEGSFPRTREKFHEAVMEDILRYRKCTERFSPRACVYDMSHSERGVRTLLGYYAIYIADWLKLYPRDHIYILRTEDWRGDCMFYLRDIYRFLELRPVPGSHVTLVCNRPREFKNVGAMQSAGDMLPETRRLLDKFFQPMNRELAQLLNDDRFLWKE